MTWGQFFVYQGFNGPPDGCTRRRAASTTSTSTSEAVEKRVTRCLYRYGSEQRPLDVRTRSSSRTRPPTGMATQEFTVYRTHHGPIVRREGEQWVSMRLMQDPVKALTQSYMRTKATNYRSFRDTMELHTNSSNNTVFADADGNIAFFFSNFIPRRAPRSTGTTRSMAAIRQPTGMECSRRREPERAESAERLDLEHQQLALYGGRPQQPEEGGLSAVRRNRRLTIRAVFMPSACSKDGRTSRWIRWLPRRFDPALPEFDLLVPTLLRAYADVGARTRAAASSLNRSRS